MSNLGHGDMPYVPPVVSSDRPPGAPMADYDEPAASPDQPDGIDEQSRDLPDPARAAARVNEFLSAWGDGLIEIGFAEEFVPAGGEPPLYARDLQALANLAARPLPAVEPALLRRLSALFALTGRQHPAAWLADAATAAEEGPGVAGPGGQAEVRPGRRVRLRRPLPVRRAPPGAG